MINFKFDPCSERNKARALAYKTGTPYQPCKGKGYLASVVCGVKEFACTLLTGIKRSWKLKMLIIFSLILLFINYGLIRAGHYNVTSEGSSAFINSAYLSTTQLTTIGYGDVIPNSDLAKTFSTFVHFVILFITLGLAEEFGAVTVARDNQISQIRNEISRDLDPIKQKLNISDELMSEIDEVVKKEFPKGIKTVEDVTNAGIKKNVTIHGVTKARDRLKGLLHRKEMVTPIDLEKINNLTDLEKVNSSSDSSEVKPF